MRLHGNEAWGPPPQYSERTPLISSNDPPEPPPYSGEPSYYDEQNPRAEARRQKDGSTGQGKARNMTVVLIVLFCTAFIVPVIWFMSKGSYIRSPREPPPPTVIRVAVVGAGPAGISTAFALSRVQFSSKKGKPDVQVDITIFEQKDRVGGRMILNPSLSATDVLSKEIHAEDVAAGCLSSNRILGRRAQAEFGVQFGTDTTSKMVESGNIAVGFFNGKDIVADIPRPREEITWGNWVKLIWRYGSSVWRAAKLPTGTMEGFNGMLDLAEKSDKSKPYVNPWEILVTGRMTGAASLSANERLAKNGIEGKYVEEVVRAQIRKQNGLDLEELSDLGLSMALEREGGEFCPNTEGGRLMHMLETFAVESRAALKLSTHVTAFKRELVEEEKEMWIVEYTQADMDELHYEAFHKVVLATPWNSSSLLFAPITETREQIFYKPVWITIIATEGELGSEHFGRSETLPSQILPIASSPDLPAAFHGIHEITHLRKLYRLDPEGHIQNTNLYRILSDQQPSNGTLEMLWGSGIEAIYSEEIEKAYPITYPKSSGDELGIFESGDGLWHTSVIEGVGSTVDLAWIVGGNVGRLVGENIKRERD
ncbi:uncharacterized protein BP5553_02726 [Venustampulla echinocandica]|uniref:Prenylcysteine lyase domain-containing protein n=1 Tax=Venustampulla echinocandica TaxID=2656787 RepID=A0A370TS80_9HELO|nr:uncharacterized protein BP5553_02726 [Venustampulla echinocandica]RDL38386.1 hypothetical protein BP5553_02726 [Venustampulla echinocandica]